MNAFVDLQADRLEGVGEVDLVLDVIGDEVQELSAPLVRAGGTLVTIASPPEVRPRDGRAVFFVAEPDRARLADLVQRLRDGRLKPIVGEVRALAEAPAAFTPGRHARGKTIIRSWTADNRRQGARTPGPPVRLHGPKSAPHLRRYARFVIPVP
ncbi:hypothetical protein TNCT6_02650 [Streptomyces sp. 6-11-2]|nr:hypothetical protein TNCT6_02650 [Streptomyces sp. 6-11-2]